MPVTAAADPLIAINAHLLSGEASYRSAGVHQYIASLLGHLDGDERRAEYVALLGEGFLPPESSLRYHHSAWPTGQPLVRILWEQLAQPWVLRKLEADLVHGPVFVGPLVSPCPSVVTIHDLSFIRYPELFRPTNRMYLTVMTKLSARRARRVIAVSAHTASETNELLGVPLDRIDVVHHGVDPVFRPRPCQAVEAFREQRGLPQRFVLAVGTLEPRKNHTRLVEAFAQIRESQTKLVLVGGKGWLYEELFAKVQSLDMEDDVIFAGYVKNGELPLWYNAATVLAYPSLYEGFGLPVLEAQASGTPVLTSSVPPLPEAAGKAAVLVDPCDTQALAAGLHQLLTDEDLRNELSKQGIDHARRFNWEETAYRTTEVYQRALGQKENL